MFVKLQKAPECVQPDSGRPWKAFKGVLWFHRAEQKEKKKDGEVDEKFWELLLSADKKDYESICAEYGVTDFRWMLRKLNEKKREIEEQQSQVRSTESTVNDIPLKYSYIQEFC